MSDSISTILEPEATPPQQRDERKRLLLYVGGTALVCLVVGTLLGTSIASPAEAKPLPAKTVEVSVVDETCKEVALELFDQLDTLNSDVVMPLLSAGKTMNAELIAVVNGGVLALNIDSVTAATGEIRGANDTLGLLTDRINTVGPDYLTCTD